MDREAKTPSRPTSGVPRLAASRLPLPTSTAPKAVKPSPSRERLRADPGLNAARLRRPSEEPIFKRPLPRISATNHTRDITTAPVPVRSPTRSGLYNGRPEPEPVVEEEEGGEGGQEEAVVLDSSGDGLEYEDRGRVRGTRPSLSERTIETLSRLPPSPASVKRKSSFFAGTSPIRSPSRPPSSLNDYSRSPSRSSFRQAKEWDSDAPMNSTVHLQSRPRIAPTPSAPAKTATLSRKPSRSLRIGPERPKQSATDGGPPDELRPSVAPASQRANVASSRTTVLAGHRSAPVRSLKSHPSPSNVTASTESFESDSGTPRPGLTVKKTRRPPSSVASSLTSPSSTTSKASSATSISSESAGAPAQAPSSGKKALKTSTALRESIAQAKAARKAAMQNKAGAVLADPWESIDVQDPFSQGPKASNAGVLRKRVDAARTSGHLNIAALSLAELPNEVLTMYDFEPNNTIEWYESVDLVKFIAADNELATLPDAAFPDIDPETYDPDVDGKGNQFGGLEVLDLHGNVLQSLPLGLRRLQRLHTLNLSNNKLSLDDIQVISDLECLTELRLASNNLHGAFTLDLSRLSKLETLDLHDNALTRIPDTFETLSSLKVLNVGQNQLPSLPLESLSKLLLRELIAPKNKLSGTLFPASVCRLDTLQLLNVANNALSKLSDNEELEIPNLQTLAVDANRIVSMPDMSSWQSLLTFSAEDNQLSEIPRGFVELKNIKNVDLTGNDISKLDERIGLMESLFSFRIASNPLRERKFLTMNTEDMKRDLRNRCEPAMQDSDDEGSVATQFTLAPENPESAGWIVKPGGVLDRSHTELGELDPDLIEAVAPQDIRCLYLQHNQLRQIPISALSLLAHSLVDLDLSHNPMDSSSFPTSALTLPTLQNLNLSSTGLTTLETLRTHFTAPSLTFLDVSNNRLTGPVPILRTRFPKLVTFLAADNQMTRLDFEAAQGLQVLDVGNNNIDSLPPKLGLLGVDGPTRLRNGGAALRRLEVAGNSFRVPRWQIVAKGTEAVLEWLKGRIPAEELAEWEAEEQYQ